MIAGDALKQQHIVHLLQAAIEAQGSALWDEHFLSAENAVVTGREENLRRYKPGTQSVYLIFSDQTGDAIYHMPLYEVFRPSITPILEKVCHFPWQRWLLRRHTARPQSQMANCQQIFSQQYTAQRLMCSVLLTPKKQSGQCIQPACGCQHKHSRAPTYQQAFSMVHLLSAAARGPKKPSSRAALTHALLTPHAASGRGGCGPRHADAAGADAGRHLHRPAPRHGGLREGGAPHPCAPDSAPWIWHPLPGLPWVRPHLPAWASGPLVRSLSPLMHPSGTR